ncbi:MAG: hypothetical protein MSA89_11420 [Clostridium sp.]|nr:hypothetical protein [Clostridium sp.]
MNKKISKIIGMIMLVVAIIFLVFALNNPQASWNWNNTITYTLYIIYLVVMIFLLISPLK